MKKEFCQHCGQSIMQHKQSLSRSLVNILFIVANRGLPSFHLQKDVNLNHNQYANFQKLKFWGLVERDENESGKWKITKDGMAFLFGESMLPRSVWTFNNKVTAASQDELISIRDLKLEPFRYKKREQYIKDATPVKDLAEQNLFVMEDF